MSPLILSIHKIKRHLREYFLGNLKGMKFSAVINFQKAAAVFCDDAGTGLAGQFLLWVWHGFVTTNILHKEISTSRYRRMGGVQQEIVISATENSLIIC